MAYVCSALCLTAMSLECCRVLQAVGYRPGRGYFRVLVSGYYVIVCIAEVAAVLMWVANAPPFAVALVYLVATAICVCIPRRCPLVFTARVWRLLAVVLALNLAVCFAEVHIAAIAVPFVVLRRGALRCLSSGLLCQNICAKQAKNCMAAACL